MTVSYLLICNNDCQFCSELCRHVHVYFCLQTSLKLILGKYQRKWKYQYNMLLTSNISHLVICNNDNQHFNPCTTCSQPVLATQLHCTTLALVTLATPLPCTGYTSTLATLALANLQRPVRPGCFQCIQYFQFPAGVWCHQLHQNYCIRLHWTG